MTAWFPRRMDWSLVNMNGATRSREASALSVGERMDEPNVSPWIIATSVKGSGDSHVARAIKCLDTCGTILPFSDEPPST